jgi:hypothetical protein
MSGEIEGIARFGVGAHEAQQDKTYKSSEAEHQLAIHGDPQFLKVAMFPITTWSNPWQGAVAVYRETSPLDPGATARVYRQQASGLPM